MPLLVPCLDYRAGLTSSPCPVCGNQLPSDVLKVNGETVVDVREEWITNGRDLTTERVVVVCIQTPRKDF